MSKTVLTHRNGAVLIASFNRPEAYNAANMDMFHAFDEAMTEAKDDSIRCVILRGEGGNFMAGGDLKMFADELSRKPKERTELFKSTIDIAHAPIEKLRALKKPVIASVDGAAAGYGLSIVNNCDLVLGSTESKYAVAYTAIGVSPDGGGSFGLVRILGVRKAMELALTNRRLDANEALALGLINQVIAPDQLEDETNKLAQELSLGPRKAFAKTKSLIWQSMDRDFHGQLEAEKQSFAKCGGTEDFAAGVKAFVTKQKPEFKGM